MVTLALIGLGQWGKNYLHTATTLKHVRIKYICAQNQQTLDLFPNSYTKVLSVDQLLKHKGIDGFIIATPAKTHFEIAKKLLASGNNLLIEKPLATNYQEAVELQKIWQAKKSKVLVGHTYLYNPAYQVAKKLAKNLRIKSIAFKGLSSPVRKDISVIWDWGPHPISILLDLIKSPIIAVRAIDQNENSNSNLFDIIKVWIRFVNNIEASIHISWSCLRKIRKLTIAGENATIELDDTNTTNQKIVFQKLNQAPQHPAYPSQSPLVNELEEFTQAIQANKKITSDLNMGVEVVKILSVIEQSLKNHGKSIRHDSI